MSIVGVPETRTVRRIAVFRALHFGDLLVSVPALRSLRAGFPQTEITLIGLAWARWFVERFSRYVDRLVEFNGFPGLREVDYDPIVSEQALQALRREEFDLVIQLHGDGSSSNRFVHSIVCPGKQSAGLYAERRPDFLTYAAPYPSGQPEVLRGLMLMRELGCPDTGIELELPLLAEDHAEAERLLGSLALERPLIGMHAGARSPARRWPAERFAQVADALAREVGACILLTGSADEVALVAEVAARMSEPAINFAGQTTLGGLAGLIARLDLFISNDTGPAHIAEALDTPSVTIFGPAEFERWAPLDRERHRVVRRRVACSPCPHWVCPIDHRCLGWIEPKEVLAAVHRQLMKGSMAS
jgi:lipopolysaccharide heptosyltransferase II